MREHLLYSLNLLIKNPNRLDIIFLVNSMHYSINYKTLFEYEKLNKFLKIVPNLLI